MRFIALAPWRVNQAAPVPADEQLVPAIDIPPERLEAVLRHIEFRGDDAFDRARLAVASGARATVYAQPPGDLPALLRTADQLLAANRQSAGERAVVFQCSCGTRYAVPTSLMRPVAIQCERCGATIELDPALATGESHLVDAQQAELNSARESLSHFFREAMARGWPVLLQAS